MRSARFVVLASLLASVLQLASLNALAQASAAPGSGHGFLIDKHAGKGIACGKCHTQNTNTPPTTKMCLACHGGTYEKLAAITANDKPNPHGSHRGEVNCAECHHIHKASVTLCNQCHAFDMATP